MDKQWINDERQKRVAMINDLACYGRCALTVSIPILSAMKYECCPLPTALLSSNAAFSGYVMKDETKEMRAIIKHWKELGISFDGILSGFFNSVEQVQIVEQFFCDFKQEQTKIFLDPIMGDNGRLYSVTSLEVCREMKRLLPYADIITPNLTECCVLLDREYSLEIPSQDGLLSIAKKLSDLGPKVVVITGIPQGKEIQNFIYEAGKEATSVFTDKIGVDRCGTGDVFMSVFAGSVMNGATVMEAVKKAVEFLNRAITYADDIQLSPRNGVSFEPFLGELA